MARLGLAVVCLGTVASPQLVSAATTSLGGQFVADFNAGAEELANLTFSDGSTQTVKTGNGLSLSVSGAISLLEQFAHQAVLQANFGVKYSTMQPAENADLSYTRWPLELLAFYHYSPYRLRFGGGVAYVLSNALKGSGAASNLDIVFKPALGWVIQSDFFWNRFGVGARYTMVDFVVKDSGRPVAANTFGIQISYLYSL